MNELTTEQMQERMQTVKEYAKQYFGVRANKDDVIIIGAGISHHEIEIRLLRIADKMSTPLHIVTVDDIHTLSSTVNQPLEDILCLLEQCSLPKPRSIADDLENLSKIAIKMKLNDQEQMQRPVIDHDDRPWYEKAANPGGKKRKQSYHNKQRW